MERLALPYPLLVAHAPRAARTWHGLCWAIDERMARAVLGRKEGAVAAIRLAWWEEALTGRDTRGGEPLLDAWRAARPDADAREAVATIAAGWRMLLDPAPMSEGDWRDFGLRRGALFGLIAGKWDKAVVRGGMAWALWDLARRDPDRSRAEGAFAAAIVAADDAAPMLRAIVPKPLRLAAAMALDDAGERRIPDERFTARQYWRLLRRAVVG